MGTLGERVCDASHDDDLVLTDLRHGNAGGVLRSWRRVELEDQVSLLASRLTLAGFENADLVLGVDLPSAESIIGFLAASRAGLRWASLTEADLTGASQQTRMVPDLLGRLRRARPRAVVHSSRTMQSPSICNDTDLACLIPTVDIIIDLDGT
jgi:hypothetical protein